MRVLFGLGALAVLSPAGVSGYRNSDDIKKAVDASLDKGPVYPLRRDAMGPPSMEELTQLNYVAGFGFAPTIEPSKKLEETAAEFIQNLPKAPVAEDWRMLAPFALSPNMYKGVDWAKDVSVAKGRPVRKCDYEFQLEDLLFSLQGSEPPSVESKTRRLEKAAMGGVANPQIPPEMCAKIPLKLRAYRAIVAESCLGEEKNHSFPGNYPGGKRDVDDGEGVREKTWSERRVLKRRGPREERLAFDRFRTPTPHSSCTELILERWTDDRQLRDQEAVLTRSTFDKKAFVSFRQTDSNLEWITTNFRFGLKKCVIKGTDCGQVHAGFKVAWDKLARLHDAYAAIRQLVRDGYKIYFVGHSLGAGVANYAALATKLNIPEAEVGIEIFGGPRVGDDKFAELFDKKVSHARRYVTFIECDPREESITNGGELAPSGNPHMVTWPDFVSTAPGSAEQMNDGGLRGAMLEVGATMGEPTVSSSDLLVSVDEERDGKRVSIDEEQDQVEEEEEEEADKKRPSRFSRWWDRVKGKITRLYDNFIDKIDKLVNDKAPMWFVRVVYTKVNGYKHTKGFTPIRCPAAKDAQCSSRAQILKTQLACHGLYFKDFQQSVVAWTKEIEREGLVDDKSLFPLKHGLPFKPDSPTE